MNTDYFTINDSNPSSIGYAKVLRGLAACFDPNMTVVSKPLIVSTHIANKQIIFENKYFYGPKNVLFKRLFLKHISERTPFVFFVLIKYFGPREFHAHTVSCSWQNNSLYIFDPNGDNVPNDDIYAAQAYRNSQSYKGLKNPVYNTLANYFSELFMTEGMSGATINVYQGPMIMCVEERACNLKSILYIIGLHKYKYNIEEAIKYAIDTSKNNQKMYTLVIFVKYVYDGIRSEYTKLLSHLES